MNKISATTGGKRLRLRISATAETLIRGGHPWVFSASVREQNREGLTGELAVIYDRKDEFLAVGWYDPASPIRVRILQAGQPTTIDANFWHRRLEVALERRTGLFDGATTGYRVINGESDGWPGLVLDRYETTYVVKIYTAAWLPHFESVLELFQSQLRPERIVLRLSRNIQRDAKLASQSWSDGMVIPPEADKTASGVVIFYETDLRFEAEVREGQKTGFFLDQRENRRAVESLARGRAVLNAFSFSGGFSLYAARGGASSVTDLDISKHALESARRNFALNQETPTIRACQHQSVCADAFEWLAKPKSDRFGLIVLDPPSLAKREAERAGAIRAYSRLVTDGLKHLANGGVLLACSCSAHVSADEFFGAVRQAARNEGRKFSELKTTRHAADHPATFPEAEYLKAIFLQFR